MVLMPFPSRDNPLSSRKVAAVSCACAFLVTVCISCSGRRALSVPPEAAESARDALSGRTSFRALDPPPLFGNVYPQRERTIQPAVPMAANALPEYPKDALNDGCGDGAVAVRIYISAEGTVAAMTAVPGHPVAQDSCHRSFSAAVETAVRPWTFFPALREPPVDGGESEPTAIHVDLEFLFEVDRGRGSVRPR